MSRQLRMPPMTDAEIEELEECASVSRRCAIRLRCSKPIFNTRKKN